MTNYYFLPLRNNSIFRDFQSPNEQQAYNLLLDGTPFGAGAKKMTEEFAEMQGKYIGEFKYEAQAPGVFHFTVYFWV